MRKNLTFTFCFLLLFSLTTLSSFAQNTSIGIKLGPAITGLSDFESGRVKMGARVGGFLTYSVSQRFGIGGEVNLVRKGAVSRNGEQISLDYVEVPLLAKFFFGKGGFRPKVFVGPYGGYLMQAQVNEEKQDNYLTEDYGVIIGAGFHQRLRKRKWFYFDIRYGYGLADILPGTTYSNRDIAVSMGVSFPLDGWIEL